MLSPCQIPNGIMPQNGVVLNPYAVKYTDAAPATLGQEGEQIVSMKGGKYATAALRGQVFTALTIGHTVQKFNNANQIYAIVNPVNSGVNVELILASFVQTTAAVVVNGLGIYYSTVAQTALWTGLTNIGTVQNAILGGGSGKAIFYTAATPGTTFLQAIIGGWGSTTLNTLSPIRYHFDGTVIIPPGIGITVSTTTANGTSVATVGGLTWMEYAA